MASIRSTHASCSCKRAQFEVDGLSIRFFFPPVGYEAFGVVYDSGAPQGCTVDGTVWYVSERCLTVVVIFETDYFQTHVPDHDVTSLGTQNVE